MDENAAKRQDPSHDDPRNRLGVDRLVRDLPGDLVGPDWLLYARLPEPKVSPDEGEGDWDSEPESQEGHQGEEGDGSRGSVVPENQVEDEEVAEDNAGTEHWCQQDVTLPFLPPERFVNPGRDVAGWSAQTDEEDESAGHQGPSVGGGEEAEAGEDQSDAGHAEELDSRAEEDWEQHSLSRRPENISVHQLPAKLLLSVLAAVNLMKKCIKFIISSQKNRVLKSIKIADFKNIA